MNKVHVAHELLEVVPQVMQTLRVEVRRQRGSELSVLQLRVLAFLGRNPGAPLSAVAEHVGLTLPSMSSQVTGLVRRKLIERSVAVHDRRYATLTLTELGRAALEAAVQGAQASLASMLTELSDEEQRLLIEAMALLRRVFTAARTPP